MPVPAIEFLRVDSIQMPHCPRQIPAGRSDEQVVMIRHQRVSVYLQLKMPIAFAHQIKVGLIIVSINEDFLAAPAAVHDMIPSSGIFNSKRARHQDSECSKKTVNCQLTIEALTPLLWSFLSVKVSSKFFAQRLELTFPSGILSIDLQFKAIDPLNILEGFFMPDFSRVFKKLKLNEKQERRHEEK